MAAGTWKVYAKAKKYIGAGTITLGAGVYKMCLHRTSASAAIKVLSTRSTWASIPGEISAFGSYVAGGNNIGPATGKWTVGASAKAYKFTYTTAGIIFSACASALNNVRYAVIRNSTGAGAGKVLCFCTLSTAAFTISANNSLTIKPDTTGGVFVLT